LVLTDAHPAGRGWFTYIDVKAQPRRPGVPVAERNQAVRRIRPVGVEAGIEVFIKVS